MKYLALLLIFGFGLSGFGQTIKSLGYNTTNGQVVYSGTNTLRLPNPIEFGPDGVGTYVSGFTGYGINLNLEERRIQDTSIGIGIDVVSWSSGETIDLGFPVNFPNSTNASITRTNLDLGWSALTNTNAATSLLGFTTNGEVVANIGTNVLKFTNNITLDAGGESMQFRITATGVAIFSGAAGEDILTIPIDDPPIFAGPYWNDPTIRQSFGFSTNLNTLWTAENTIAARQVLGLQSYTNTLTNSVGDVEIGSTVNSVTIGWTINPTNATYALRRLVGAGQTNNITNNSSALALTSLGLTNNTTWTLTVGDGSGVTNTATTSVNFYNYMTWGRSANTSLDNAAIQSLHTNGGGAGRAFATSRSRSVTMDGGGQYLYIAYPQGFGAASFVVGGLPNSAFTVFTNSYTNANGYITNYLIYRTDTIQNGTGINIVVQ